MVQRISNYHLKLLICCFLIIAVLAVFWQVKHCDFIIYDDEDYITENINIQNGITTEGIRWAFTTSRAANWHPLTWLSHMLDCQLFGLKPGRHHLTNVFFHIANTLLLFLILNRMTRALWQSAFVAALFALHPLHVESAAWVSEREDVLSTFFWMLTMGAYISYVELQTLKRYLPVLIFCFRPDGKTHAGNPSLCPSPSRLLAPPAIPAKKIGAGNPNGVTYAYVCG